MTPSLLSDFNVPIQITNSTLEPISPDSAPTWRLYGAGGLVASGTCDNLLTGVISNVTNDNPAVVTDTAHGLTTGTVVTIQGVGGATGVNGANPVTRLTADTFSVPVAAGGAYTSGGTWAITGAYVAAFDSTVRALLEPGQTYTIFFDYAVSSSERTEAQTFTAV